MILHNSKRRSWHLILASAVVFGLTQFCQPGEASAQVLNDRVNELLANNCGALGHDGNPGNTNFGNNLNALCAVPTHRGGHFNWWWRSVSSRVCFVDFEQSGASTVV